MIFTQRRLFRIKAIRAITLVELTTVLVVLGVVAAVSYPSMFSFYHSRQVTAAALDIASYLSTARSLSIAGLEGRLYGVIFFDDPENSETRYSIYSVPPGTLVTGAALAGLNNTPSDTIIPYGEKGVLPQSVEITNFAANKFRAFSLFFLEDGIPTHDGVNFPVTKENEPINLSSRTISFALSVHVSHSTGHSGVK